MRCAIILNGPPGCGKDTIGKVLCNVLDACHLEFKSALYEEVDKYYNLPNGYTKHLNSSATTDEKMQPRAEYKYYSLRGALIHVSEAIIKPNYGHSFFGEKLAEAIVYKSNKHSTCVITDGGFYSELLPVASVVDTLYLFNVHREGCVFTHDSRSYLIDTSMLPDNTYRQILDNNGTVQDAVDAVVKTLSTTRRT